MHEQIALREAAPEAGALLSGWISRSDLAQQLDVTEGTLRRWEAERWGPPCIRAGRKIYYRRTAVLKWLEEQEGAGQRRGRRGVRR
jgi:hypothetical protein